MHHILLIDDNAFFTATFAGLLKKTGFRVDVASEPAQAQEIHDRDPADLILMGIYLNKHSADEYLGWLRGPFAGTAVIGLFAPPDRNHRHYPRLVKALGLTRCYAKPFRTEELLESIYGELDRLARRAG